MDVAATSGESVVEKAPRIEGSVCCSMHPGIAMETASMANLLGTTGRSLDEWGALVRGEGPETENERAVWLKHAHGLGTNVAGWIAERAAGRGPTYDSDALVASMFSGPKAGLRPIYDRLLDLAFSLGDDVSATPCATIVPLRRRQVFAQVKPSTWSRIDLGFALGDLPPAGRLLDTGGRAKGDRITHRNPISCPVDVDEEVVYWLRTAYELDDPALHGSRRSARSLEATT